MEEIRKACSIQNELENLPHPRFLEFRHEYKAAKYVFNPVLFERGDSFIPGAGKGPSRILQASHVIEKYHIATDQKTYATGFFTNDAYVAASEEDQIYEVNTKLTNQFAKGKVPVTLLGDGSGAIGAYYALNKMKPAATILNIDAHLCLRETMGGTRNHRFTKMHHAKACSNNVLHFGVSSMGNREKELFNPDKIFFAEDVHEDEYWLEDVLSEIKNDVYVSIDASAFEHGSIPSQNPSTSNITYKQVEKLLRAIAKEHNIIGIDISGFVPQETNKGAEISLATLIYDVISHIEAK